MKAIFVAVQDQESRKWSPVAKVNREDGQYKLTYTKGAKELRGFSGFGRMSELDTEYFSDELFPLLQNRVLPRSRPEYKDYLEWLGLTMQKHDALEELSRTGGLRATDSIELIPCPEPTSDNRYEAYFFVRGIRHFPKEVGDSCNRLKSGDRLFILKDVQNKQDENALLLRTDDPISLIGYAPRYYSEDFSALASGPDVSHAVVTVERVNTDAPLPYRILCKITAPWPSQFSACTTENYQTFSNA